MRRTMVDFLANGSSSPMKMARPVFVLGCYRSGKTTLLNALKSCHECSVYHETNEEAYHDYRIKSETSVRSLIDRSRSQCIVFELVNDLQYADRYLNVYPGSKAIWLYRTFQGVIESAITKWGALWRDFIVGVAKGYHRHPAELTLKERMSAATFDLIKEEVAGDISPEEGAALLWYARNIIYYDLELYKDERVILMNYEDLVSDPVRNLSRVFDFISCPYNQAYAKGINPAPKQTVPPVLKPEVNRLCEKLLKRLDEQYALELTRREEGR